MRSRFRNLHAAAHGYVVGDLLTAHRNRIRCQISPRSKMAMPVVPAPMSIRHTQIAFIVVQYGLGAGQQIEHHAIHAHAAAVSHHSLRS